MAIAQSDGSIILTTGIDGSGIKLGLEEMKRAAKSAVNTFSEAGKALSNALADGNTQLANIAKNAQKASAEYVAQSEKVSRLQKQLEELQTKGAATPAIVKMREEMDALNAQIEEATMRYEGMAYQLQDMLNNAKHITDANGQVAFVSPEDQAAFDSLKGKMDELYSSITNNTNRAAELDKELKLAVGEETQKQVDVLTQKLADAGLKLNDIASTSDIAAQKLQIGMDEAANHTQNAENKTENLGNGLKTVAVQANSVTDGFTKMGNRILRTAKTILFFGLFRRAFSSLRSEIGNALMANEQLRSSLESLEAVLWTIAAPIYEAVLPALQMLMHALVKALMYVVAFIAGMTGKSLQDMISAGNKLQKQAKNYENVSKSGDKAAKSTGNVSSAMKKLKEETEETNKELAEFDELMILQSNTIDDTDVAGGGGVAPVDLDLDDNFQELLDALDSDEWKSLQEFSSWVNENKEWIGIALLVLAVAGLIAKILELLGAFQKKDKALDTQTEKTGKETSAVTSLATALATAGATAGAMAAAQQLLSAETESVAEEAKEAEKNVDELSATSRTATDNALADGESLRADLQKTDEKISGKDGTKGKIDLLSMSLALLGTQSKSSGDDVSTSAGKMDESVKTATDNMKSNVAAFVSSALDNLKKWGTNSAGNVGLAAYNLAKSIYDALNQSGLNINGFLEASSSSFAKWGENISSSIAKSFSNIVTSIGNALSSAWESVKTWAIETYKSVYNTLYDLGAEARSNKTAVYGYGTFSPKSWSGQGITGLSGLGSLSTGLIGLGSLASLGTSPIPIFAKGGIVPRATLGLVGEAGQEAVLPLERNTEWMDMLADRIAARNSNGSTVILEIDGREFGRAVVQMGGAENRRIGTRLVVG